jgi:hypothetical protein
MVHGQRLMVRQPPTSNFIRIEKINQCSQEDYCSDITRSSVEV